MSHIHFYFSSLNAHWNNLLFLILKWQKSASWFSLAGPGKLFSGTFLVFLCTLCHTGCSFIILFLLTEKTFVLSYFLPFLNIYAIWFYSHFFSNFPFAIVFWIYWVRDHQKKKSILAYAFTRLREFCIPIV